MIQLQTRVAQYIGHPNYNAPWRLAGLATRITKDMKRPIREQSYPVEHGTYEYRIVDTKKTPERAVGA